MSDQQSESERERDVRVLTSLTRALRDMRSLSETISESAPEKTQEKPERSEAEVEQLRQEVARKLYAMLASHQQAERERQLASPFAARHKE